MDREELRATLKLLGYVRVRATYGKGSGPVYVPPDAHYKLYTAPSIQASIRITFYEDKTWEHCYISIASSTTGYPSKELVCTFDDAYRAVLQWEEHAS